MSAIEIKLAEPKHAEVVGGLIARLLMELDSLPASSPKLQDLSTTAKDLLAKPRDFAALIAWTDEGEAVAALTLSRCAALYAGGEFGEIAEFYVVPAWRGRKVGAAMVEAAVAEAHRRGWPRLEVGAPPVPEWQRSVAFYQCSGFTEVGPRLVRLLPAEAAR